MWLVSGNNLQMAEGDFGILLPITISGTTFAAGDEINFVLKDRMNGNTLIEKVFSNITENTVNLSFTEEESNGLSIGTYVYRLDWYQNGIFMCNIILNALFRVVDKA